MDEIFDNMPTDYEDTILNDWELQADIANLSREKKIIWRRALKWALEQDLWDLEKKDYVALETGENFLFTIKFKQKLFDKFDTRV